jgi:sortase A
MIEIKPESKKMGTSYRPGRVLRMTQRILIGLGTVLLTFYVVVRIHGVVTTQAAILSFEDAAARAEADGGADNALTTRQAVDYSLWSALRVKLYKESLKRVSDPPLGLLKIPKLHMVAPVLDGTGNLALNVGVGRIQGTSRPGERGNVGIAGHRDGFFRGLKDITKGDTIELVTKAKTDVYVVDAVNIVNPADVKVLGPSSTPSLTLVTCYPFYFAGSAPKRYIVHASLREQ